MWLRLNAIKLIGALQNSSKKKREREGLKKYEEHMVVCDLYTE